MEADRWIGWVGRAAAAAWLAALIGLALVVALGAPLPLDAKGMALALGALLAGLAVLALEAVGAGLGVAHDASEDAGLLRRAGGPRHRATRPIRWN